MSVNNINSPSYFQDGISAVSIREKPTLSGVSALPENLTSPTPSERPVTTQVEKFTRTPSFDGTLEEAISPEAYINPSTLSPGTFYNCQSTLQQTLSDNPATQIRALNDLLKRNEENLAELRTRYLSLLGA